MFFLDTEPPGLSMALLLEASFLKSMTSSEAMTCPLGELLPETGCQCYFCFLILTQPGLSQYCDKSLKQSIYEAKRFIMAGGFEIAAQEVVGPISFPAHCAREACKAELLISWLGNKRAIDREPHGPPSEHGPVVEELPLLLGCATA